MQLLRYRLRTTVTLLLLLVALLHDLSAVAAWEFSITAQHNILLARESPSHPLGVVCDDFFSPAALRVVTTQLRAKYNISDLAPGQRDYFSFVAVASAAARQLAGTFPVVLDDVRCPAGAATLASCSFVTDHDCSSGNEAITVFMNAPSPNITFSLGENGVVLARIGNDTAAGPICDDFFSDAAAKLIAAQVGCSDLTRVFWGGVPVSTNSTDLDFRLDDIVCQSGVTGDFSVQCSYLLNDHNCIAAERVGLFCDSSVTFSARIIPNAGLSGSGTLQLAPSNSWRYSYLQHNNTWLSTSYTRELFCSPLVIPWSDPQFCSIVVASSQLISNFISFNCTDAAVAALNNETALNNIAQCAYEYDGDRQSAVPTVAVQFSAAAFQVGISEEHNLVVVGSENATSRSPVTDYYARTINWCARAGLPSSSKMLTWPSFLPHLNTGEGVTTRARSSPDSPLKSYSLKGRFVFFLGCSDPQSLASCSNIYYLADNMADISPLHAVSCDGKGLIPRIDYTGFPPEQQLGSLFLQSQDNGVHVPVAILPSFAEHDNITTAIYLCWMMGFPNTTADTLRTSIQTVSRPYPWSVPTKIIENLRCRDAGNTSRNSTSAYSPLHEACDFAVRDISAMWGPGSAAHQVVLIDCNSSRKDWEFSLVNLNTGAPSTTSGLLLVRSPQQGSRAGTVCFYGATMGLAQFVCRKLLGGSSYDKLRVSISITEMYDDRLKHGIGLNAADCPADSSDFETQCTWDTNTWCWHDEALLIDCAAPSREFNFSVVEYPINGPKSAASLPSSSPSTVPMLRVSLSSGKTGLVCAGDEWSTTPFTPYSAKIACNASLGITDFSARKNPLGWRRGGLESLVGQTAGLQAFSCSSSATSRYDCLTTPDPFSACNGLNNVALSCDGSTGVHWLVTQPLFHSTLMVAPAGADLRHFGVNVDQNALLLLCRLAARGGGNIQQSVSCSPSQFPPQYSLWIDNVSCPPTATRLNDCQYDIADYISESARVRCYTYINCGAPQQWTLRLDADPAAQTAADSSNYFAEQSSGFLTARSSGSDFFGLVAATQNQIDNTVRTACQNLGFPGAVSHKFMHQPSATNLSMCELYCVAVYAQIASCRYSDACAFFGDHQVLWVECAARTSTTTTTSTTTGPSTTSTTTTTSTSTTVEPASTTRHPSDTNTLATITASPSMAPGSSSTTAAATRPPQATTTAAAFVTTASSSGLPSPPTPAPSAAPTPSPPQTAAPSATAPPPTTTLPVDDSSTPLPRRTAVPTTGPVVTSTTTATKNNNNNSLDNGASGGASGGDSAASGAFEKTGIPLIAVAIALLVALILLLLWRSNRNKQREQAGRGEEDGNLQMQILQDATATSAWAAGAATLTGGGGSMTHSLFGQDPNTLQPRAVSTVTSPANVPSRNSRRPLDASSVSSNSGYHHQPEQDPMARALLEALVPSSAHTASTTAGNNSKAVGTAPPAAAAAASSTGNVLDAIVKALAVHQAQAQQAQQEQASADEETREGEGVALALAAERTVRVPMPLAALAMPVIGSGSRPDVKRTTTAASAERPLSLDDL